MILRLAINSDSFLIPRFWFVVMRDLIHYKLDNCKLGKNVRCRLNLKFSLNGFTVFTKLHVKKITGVIAFQCKIVKKPEEFT